ncbi:MAG: tRNA (adenosine(37)-N6)-dimethylallyltransferase MiaA [Planctomycetia bacterium]
MNPLPDDVWYLTGPTASGKSAAALAVAETLDAEIVALDSMTVYREMDVGTAKPSAADRARVPHHLVDVLDPNEAASLDWYLREASRVSADVRSRGRRVLFVGGTPLYLKACLRGIFDGPPADPVLRGALEAEAAAVGVAALHQRLAAVDPGSAVRILPGDLRRIIRALEVYQTTGRPITELQTQFDAPADPPPRVACLRRPRAELVARINARTLDMLNAGWIEETERLLTRRPPPSREARQAVGCDEIDAYLKGSLDRNRLIDTLQVRTRQFAKRQMTWMRSLAEVRFVDVDETTSFTEIVDRLVRFFSAPSDRSA